VSALGFCWPIGLGTATGHRESAHGTIDTNEHCRALMGGFHLTREDPAADARIAAARARFVAHGFTRFTPVATPTHRGFHVGHIHGGPDTIAIDGEDFAAAAGTLVYDDLLGRAALSRLLADFTFPFTDWHRLTGQFALIVHKNRRAYALTDYFGAFQLFHDPAYDTLSTSFLATVEAQSRVRWHTQGIYEFAFNVFPIGDDTVIEEVRRLGPDTQLELGPSITRHPVAKPLAGATETMPIGERLKRSTDVLSATVAPFVTAYGNEMQCPLSGGLDSRLALAVLRAHGVRPHVYVYGTPDDEDASIAAAIGRAEGFPVEIFNKPAAARVTTDEYAAIVARNFDETDALVTDGGLFDNGGNAMARHARNLNGQLAVSGGCGEVFRNFFYLPDQRLRARDVALAFFARFVRADTTRRFDARAFFEAIEAKLAHALGPAPGDALGRTETEQLYPRERCRAFFGREISLVGRHGGYLMPFMYHAVVDEALRIPMRLKRAGHFEAMLLNHIDPALALHMSAYGHHFAGAPNAAHRRDEWQTVIRPPRVRQQGYAVRRWLGTVQDEHGGLMTPAYLGRVIDLHFPAMRCFFDVEHAKGDAGLYRRIATLEYLAQHLGSRLSEN